MSQAVGAHIYTGPWIHWSHGIIRGSTLTLSSADGGLLTAFLGIFVTAAGAAVWRILSYLIHQVRTSSDPQDGFHHQQQLILRNNGSSGGAAWQFFQMVFFWWKSAKRPLLRSLPLTILALCNLLLFAVAGVFSSEVTKSAGNETLIRSPNCGSWTLDGSGSQQEMFAYQSKILNDTITAASYARACYGSAQNVLQCNQFAQQQIKWTTNKNASCPFESGVCFDGDTAAYEMDTGPIDSHAVLGINAPEHERVTYRKVTTCSPVHLRGHVQDWNNTDKGAGTYGETFQQFYLGPIVDVSNFTYEYSEHSYYDSIGYTLKCVSPHPSLSSHAKCPVNPARSSVSAIAGYDNNAWQPIPAFNRTDADVAIFLLAPNSISYMQPVTDPFFSANIPVITHIPGSTANTTYYTSDYFVHGLGCIDQHQFCNPTSGDCTPLSGYNIAFHTSTRLGLTPVQQYTADRLSLTLNFVNMYYSVNGRGSSALRAQEGVYELTQGPLPPTQWMIEVDSWFAVGMAKLQQLVVQYAAGPSVVLDGTYNQKPGDAIGKAMCRRQIVRNGAGGTISFSVVGVVIILVVGTGAIVMNLFLDIIVGFFQRKFGVLGGDYKRLSWVVDDKLQMQRMAYEEVGMGVWKGGADAVPVTRFGDRWALPREVDRDHPRLGTGHGKVENVEAGMGMGEGEGLMGERGKSWVVDEVEH